MPWPIRMMPSVDAVYAAEQRGECSFGMAVVQSMGTGFAFSDDYKERAARSCGQVPSRDNPDRRWEVVWVRLPCHSQPDSPLPEMRYEGQWFVPDKRYEFDGEVNQWTVVGEWPKVTVSPSIRCPGSYHGYISDGVLSDDCDDRKF